MDHTRRGFTGRIYDSLYHFYKPRLITDRRAMKSLADKKSHDADRDHTKSVSDKNRAEIRWSMTMATAPPIEGTPQLYYPAAPSDHGQAEYH